MKKTSKLLFILMITILTFFISTNVFAKSNATRLSGNDRYETSSKVALAGWTQSDYAVLASGEDYPDALCSAPLAGKYNAPVLLTKRDSIPSSILNVITQLGVKNVFIVGGTGVISEAVQDRLASMGITITRLYGQTRYETDIAVAKQIGTVSQIAVVTGEDYADALSIAPIAVKLGIPIILVKHDSIPQTVRDYVAAQNISKAYVIGKGSSISDIAGLPNVTEINGQDKYTRNIAIINNFKSSLSFSTFYFATGENFADALSGSVLAGINDNPLMLIGGNISDERSLFQSAASNANIKILGGTGAISDSTISDINTTSSSDAAVPSSTNHSIGLGQTVAIPNILFGSYDITINSIQLVSDRNQLDTSNPAEVYKINYTYELLSEGTAADIGLFLYNPFKAIDSTWEAGYSYPGSTSNHPEDLKTPGSKCTADTFIAVKNATTSLTLTLDYNTSGGSSYVTFSIPTSDIMITNDDDTAVPTGTNSSIGLGQTVAIPNALFGSYDITINSVQLVSDRNQLDTSNPAEVYKINYTYELLSEGSEADIGLLLYNPFKSVDSTGETGYDYPGSTSNHPEDLKTAGSKCTADTFIAVKNATTSLTLTLDYNIPGGSSYITFNIPTKIKNITDNKAP